MAYDTQETSQTSETELQKINRDHRWQLDQISKIAVKLARQDILKLAAEEGLTPDRIMRAISEALEASRGISIKGKDGETIIEAAADHNTRLKAATLGIDIWGLRDPETTRQATQVNFKINLSGKEIKTND